MLPELRRFTGKIPHVLSLRDLLGCAFTDKSKTAHSLNSQICAWIAVVMTPILQLTDTDEAFIMKAGSRGEKTNIVGEMKVAANDDSEGCGYSDFKCGAFEIMRISNAGHAGMKVANQKDQTVVGGMRRNGFCSPTDQILLLESL